MSETFAELDRRHNRERPVCVNRTPVLAWLRRGWGCRHCGWLAEIERETMKLHHWYHVYAAGDWEEPVTEHFEAVRTSGLAGHLASTSVGIVGPPDERARVVEYLRRMYDAHMPWWRTVPCVAVEADEGWEQITLDALREWVGAGVGISASITGGAVLYAHTKGAAVADGGWNATWRRGMTNGTVRQWELAMRQMRDRGVDAVGCHWLTPEAHPDNVHIPFFGGNFWWATVEFLRTLPPLEHETRYDAEAWIGRGPRRPAVTDLAPGWPGESTVLR